MAGAAPSDGAGAGAAGYEDWYLLDDWAAVGVLEEAAVVARARDRPRRVAAAGRRRRGLGLSPARGQPAAERDASVAVWVAHEPGHDRASPAALLGDGMDPRSDGLWRRCLGLGPAPEYCLLARRAARRRRGRAACRAGWAARSVAREVVWSG